MLIAVGMLVIVQSLTIEPLSLWLFTSIGKGVSGNEIRRDHDMLGPQFWRSEIDAAVKGWKHTPIQVN